MNSLEEKYVIPKENFKMAYAGLLKGLLQYKFSPLSREQILERFNNINNNVSINNQNRVNTNLNNSQINNNNSNSSNSSNSNFSNDIELLSQESNNV